MDNVQFVHNLCVNCGLGWSYDQRPDLVTNPSAHLSWTVPHLATTTNTIIKNNIFYRWRENLVRTVSTTIYGPEDFDIDYNCYYDENGFRTAHGSSDTSWTYFTSIAQWRENYNKDFNSFTKNPLMLDPNGLNFHLQRTSPCIDTGVDVGVNEDYDEVSRLNIPDIGAFEFNDSGRGDAAIFLTGHTYGATEQVTNTKLNNMMNNASISNIHPIEFDIELYNADLNATTPNISNANVLKLTNNTYCSIPTILGARVGQRFTLLSQQASTPSIIDINSFKLNSDWIPAKANDNITLVWDGTNFIEIGRTVT